MSRPSQVFPAGSKIEDVERALGFKLSGQSLDQGDRDLYNARYRPNTPDDGTTLADITVHALLSKKAKGWASGNPSTQELMRSKMMGQRIAKCPKFFVDAETNDLVTTASLLNPEILYPLVLRGRPPYASTWIEWDNSIRLNALYHLEMTEEPTAPVQKMGVFIESIGESQAAYQVTTFAWDEGYGPANVKGLALYPYQTVVDLSDLDGGQTLPDQMNNPLGRILAQVEAEKHDGWFKGYHDAMYADGPQSQSWNEQSTPLKNECAARVLMLSPGYISRSVGRSTGDIVLKPGDPGAGDIRSLLTRFTMQPSPYMASGFNKKIQTLPTRERQSFVVTQMLKETSGEIRWLMTLLGLLNSYTIDASEKRVESTGTGRSLSSKAKPQYTYHLLKVKVPSKKPIIRIEKDFRQGGAKRRAHLVRGHWRLPRNKTEKTWIAAHQRGDINLGWVQKDYQVEREDHAVQRPTPLNPDGCRSAPAPDQTDPGVCGE